jgi:hypothetical protein
MRRSLGIVRLRTKSHWVFFTLYAPLFFHMLATCPAHIIPPWFDHSAIFGEDIIIQFSPASYYFTSPRFGYSPQQSTSETPYALSFPLHSRPSFPPIVQASCLNEQAVLLYKCKRNIWIRRNWALNCLQYFSFVVQVTKDFNLRGGGVEVMCC